MSSTTIIPQIAADLCEHVENRYQIVLQIAKLAKRLLDEQREARHNDPFQTTPTHHQPEKVIYQALIIKASEMDLGNELIG